MEAEPANKCIVIRNGAVMVNKTSAKRKRKALCIASMASNLDNFNRSNVDILLGLGYEVTLAANFHTEEDSNSQEKIDSFAIEMQAKGVHIVSVDFSRKMMKLDIQIKSVLQVRKLLLRRFDLIHCHSPICSVIVRMEAKKYRKQYGTKVIYTAHGFHFYSGAPLKNWIIFYTVEKWMSRYTDVLITINREDYRRAKEQFHAKRVIYIPGVGVDMKKFNSGLIDPEEKRRELGVGTDTILLLSVGELLPRKNHEVVIKALAKLVNSHICYYIAGRGEMESELKGLVHRLGLDGRVFFLGYRTDISELCQAADIFVFPSHQEGLSLALMEAIACETPVICSDIRGNTDLVNDKAFLFNENCVDDVVRCLETLAVSRETIYKKTTESVEANKRALKAYDISEIEKMMENEFQRWG